MPGNIIDKSNWGGEQVFDAVLADIRRRRQEFEKQRYISRDIVEDFKQIGIYRSFVPKAFGGDNRTPSEFLQLIEALAAADGSAGWVASFGMSSAYLAALPLATIKKVWQDSPNVVFAGGIFPLKPATRVKGGFKVKGRWQFASGCMGASLLGVGIVGDGAGELPRMAVLPSDHVRIDKTWDTHGMIASGSFDLVIEDVVVPEEWTFIGSSTPTLDTAFFRYPSLVFAAQVLSATTLGIAREALDIVLAMPPTRESVTDTPLVGSRVYAQIEIAKAEARLRSARAFFYQVTDDAWQTVQNGGKPSQRQTSLVRLATKNLTHLCINVTQTVYSLADIASTYYEHPLSRCFRDTQLIKQHTLMGDITYQKADAMIFGRQLLPDYL